MNSLLRTSLSALVLILAQEASAQTELTLTGPIGLQQLIETVAASPETEILNLEGAQLEGDRIPAGLFAGSKVREVRFPQSGRITIDAAAFMGTPLTALNVPSSVVALGEGAFAACPALKEVTIHGAKIGNYAFQQCSALEKVVLDGVEAIGDHAFEGCGALSELIFDQNLKTIGEHALSHTALTSFNGNEGLTDVGAWALSFNHSLRSVSFPDGATLGEGVLFDCPAIESLRLPAALSAVPAFAFTGSSGLGDHRVPPGVDTIGAMAYKDTDLSSIALPSTLTHIGSYAMENTSQLGAIDATRVQGVPSLGIDVWSGVNQSLVVLNVPDELREHFRTALQWQDFNIDPASVNSPEAAATAVRMAFDGDNLIIEATGPISRIEIFNQSGARFLCQDVASTLVTIPTANLPKPLMLVRCTLGDGTVASAKLLR